MTIPSIEVNDTALLLESISPAAVEDTTTRNEQVQNGLSFVAEEEAQDQILSLPVTVRARRAIISKHGITACVFASLLGTVLVLAILATRGPRTTSGSWSTNGNHESVRSPSKPKNSDEQHGGGIEITPRPSKNVGEHTTTFSENAAHHLKPQPTPSAGSCNTSACENATLLPVEPLPTPSKPSGSCNGSTCKNETGHHVSPKPKPSATSCNASTCKNETMTTTSEKPLPNPSGALCNTSACSNNNNTVVDTNTIGSSLNASVDPCDNFYEFACQGWQRKNPRPDYTGQWDIFTKLAKETENVVTAILENNISTTQINPPALKQAQQLYKTCMDIAKSDSLSAQNTPENEDNERALLKPMHDILESYGGWPMLYKRGTWQSTNFNWMKSLVDLKKRFAHPNILDISSFQSRSGDIAKNVIVVKNPTSKTKKIVDLAEIAGHGKAHNTTGSIQKFIVNVARELLISKGISSTDIDEKHLEFVAMDILLVQYSLIELREKVVDDGFKIWNGLYSRMPYAEMTVDKLQILVDRYVGFDNKMKVKELLDIAYGSSGVTISGNDQVFILEIDYLLVLAKFLSSVRQEELANYLHFYMAFEMASMTTSKMQGFVDELLRSLGGTTGQRARSSVCTARVQKKFDHVLGQAYIKHRYSNPNDSLPEFTEIRKMFQNVKESVNDIVQSSSDISIATKRSVVEKTNSTKMCTGFQSWIYDNAKVQAEYNGLVIPQSTFLEQTLAINTWLNDKQLKTLRESLHEENRDCEWQRFVGMVGAFNIINHLTVFLPAGIIQAPFFSMNFPSVINYARLGFVLGHELTHGFTSDLATVPGMLTKRAKCFVEQYNKFSTDELRRENLTVNGKLTLEENLPDTAGLLEAFHAFKRLDKNNTVNEWKRTESLEQYTYDQIFFIGFAQTFCGSSTVENLKIHILQDVHSPGVFRVLGALRNSNEFAKAWNCPVGSSMNPVPSDREKCSPF